MKFRKSLFVKNRDKSLEDVEYEVNKHECTFTPSIIKSKDKKSRAPFIPK